MTKPFHEAIGCALNAVRATLEATMSSISPELEHLTKQDIELNQVAARMKIMSSGQSDWKTFVKLH